MAHGSWLTGAAQQSPQKEHDQGAAQAGCDTSWKVLMRTLDHPHSTREVEYELLVVCKGCARVSCEHRHLPLLVAALPNLHTAIAAAVAAASDSNALFVLPA